MTTARAFRGFRFPAEVILWAVRWYLQFPISYRDLERMLADPPAHRWRRIANADLGLPGCTTYHVRPRAGLLGMLMGWWEVKVSGGCPLPSPSARGRRGTRSRWSSSACSPASCCSSSAC